MSFSKCVHWTFCQRIFLVLVLMVHSCHGTDSCNFHASLHQQPSLGECSINIEAICYDFTTNMLTQHQKTSFLAEPVVLHVKTSPYYWSNHTTSRLHFVSILESSPSSSGWSVILPENISESMDCIRVSLETTGNGSQSLSRANNGGCIGNCNQLDEEPPVVQFCDVSEVNCSEISVITDSRGRMLAIVDISGSYYLKAAYNQACTPQDIVSMELLQLCLFNDTFTSRTFPNWLPYSINDTHNSDDCQTFIPKEIIESYEGFYIIGVNGIFHSFNLIDYRVIQVANITSFNAIPTEGGQFVFTTLVNSTLYVYYGLTSTAEVVRLEGMELEAILNGPLDDEGRVYWNQTSSILSIILSNGTSIPLLLPTILINSWTVLTSNVSNIHPITTAPSYPFSYSQLHELITPPTDLINLFNVCPFVSSSIIARICSVYSRTNLIIEDNVISNFTQLRQAYNDCNTTVDWLPSDIYLTRGASYHFTLDYQLQRFDPTTLFLLHHVSDKGVVAVDINASWDPVTNTKSHQIVLSDWIKPGSQVRTGQHIAITRIYFQVWRGGLSCITNSSGPMRIYSPGFHEITIRIGCPPGLLFLYDRDESIRQQNQYCQQKENRTCLYFENEFRPVFKVMDEVTGFIETYTNQYTLRILSGGVSVDSMTSFDPDIQIEGLVWSPSNNKYSNDTVFDFKNRGITWMCTAESPCGNILPTTGGTPEYCFLLEASNLGIGRNDSFCHFSVEFVVCVHGIGMGTAGITTSLTVLIVFLSSMVVIGFVFWKLSLVWDCRGRRRKSLIWKLASRSKRNNEEHIDQHEMKSTSYKELICRHKTRIVKETSIIEEQIEPI